MKRNVTWILVADSARARLFESPGGDDWRLIGEYEHVQSRENNKDLMPNRGPRIQNNGEGADYRNALEPTTLWDVEAKRFANELNDILKRGVAQHQFEDLIVVAPPKFLGVLRRQFDKPVMSRVRQEIQKEMTDRRPEDIAPMTTG